MTMLIDHITTEYIRKKFKNNFDLCNFSINIARNEIQSGNSTSLRDVLQTIDHRTDESPRS